MNDRRYALLMKNDSENLTQEEIELGWHFCNEFDGLLVGPGMGELDFCHCWPTNHKVYWYKIGRDWFEDSSIERWFPITAEEIKSLKSLLHRCLNTGLRHKRYRKLYLEVCAVFNIDPDKPWVEK